VIELRERLERLVPDTPAEGDWERVLADAQRPQLRRLGLVLPLAAAAAAIAVVVLAWPFGGERPTGVLDRALAAIGQGPVLHVVYRGESGHTLVDLSSGELTPLVAESELWYDPKRGVHYISRVGSVTQSDRVIARRLLSAREERAFLALADNYRAALESGKAKVIGPGAVGGRPVLWIRVWSDAVPDVRGGPDHIVAEEVAIDRETSEPVYARITEDGRSKPGNGRAIITLERLSADAADFDAKEASDEPQKDVEGRTEFGKLLAPGEFSGAVGGAAFWLGPSYDGEQLADAREFTVRHKTTRKGLYLFYGELRRDGENLLRALSKPKVVLEEFRELPDFWISGAHASAAKEGSLLVTNARVYEGGKEVAVRTGIVLRDGTYVSIQGADVRTVLDAAAALRPSTVEAAPPSTLDLATIAREVEASEGQVTEVTGPRRSLTAD
jgi:hypothetical protein